MPPHHAYHTISAEDRNRIRCQKTLPGGCSCGAPVVICQHAYWHTGNRAGVSFFYFCATHDPRVTNREAA